MRQLQLLRNNLRHDIRNAKRTNQEREEEHLTYLLKLVDKQIPHYQSSLFSNNVRPDYCFSCDTDHHKGRYCENCGQRLR